MKNLVVVVLSLMLFSCSATKNVRNKEKVIKGNWTLNKITYSKTGDYKVTLFNDAAKECFEGSTWRFIPNNNSGLYTINNGNCPTGDRNFIFTIQQVDETTGLYRIQPGIGSLKFESFRDKPEDWQQYTSHVLLRTEGR